MGGLVNQHGMMTKLIDDLELVVLKSNPKIPDVKVNGEDLLILIEYARQLEFVIQMMDADPKKAQDVLKS